MSIQLADDPHKTQCVVWKYLWNVADSLDIVVAIFLVEKCRSYVVSLVGAILFGPPPLCVSPLLLQYARSCTLTLAMLMTVSAAIGGCWMAEDLCRVQDRSDVEATEV